MCRKLALAATALAMIAAQPSFAESARTPAAAAVALDATKPQVKAGKEQRAVADRSDPLARAAFWAREYDLDGNDMEAGLKLSAALRALGQNDQAIEAASSLTLLQPQNLEAQLELGRAHLATGQGFYAIPALKAATSLAPRDWRAQSLMGVALEQVGRLDDAQSAYQQALALSPDNPAVLTNLGLFQMERGNLAEAESLLRRAAAQSGATTQIRQNLAYVLGRAGKLNEAERILREDLPPDVANNNLAYLRAATEADNSARSWDALRSDGG